jgi:uncharacterized membrane protein HdeD (DUF308 family)
MAIRNEKLVQAAMSAKQRVSTKLGHVWWTIMIRGILAIALAVCAFVWPTKTVGLLVKLLGTYFAIDGAVSAIGAYRGNEKAATTMQAIAGLSLGLILLFWPGVSAKLFLILVGVWLIMQGLGLLLAAFRMDSSDGTRNLTFGIGAAMAVIGAVFVFWTDTGVVTVSWLIGIGTALIGVLLILLAGVVRRLRKGVEGLGNRTDREPEEI